MNIKRNLKVQLQEVIFLQIRLERKHSLFIKEKDEYISIAILLYSSSILFIFIIHQLFSSQKLLKQICHEKDVLCINYAEFLSL